MALVWGHSLVFTSHGKDVTIKVRNRYVFVMVFIFKDIFKTCNISYLHFSNICFPLCKSSASVIWHKSCQMGLKEAELTVPIVLKASEGSKKLFKKYLSCVSFSFWLCNKKLDFISQLWVRGCHKCYTAVSGRELWAWIWSTYLNHSNAIAEGWKSWFIKRATC